MQPAGLLIADTEVVNKMGMTIAEKIIAAAAGAETVQPGDIHTVTLDRMMSNDGTTHLTIDMYNRQLTNPSIADTKKLVFIVDHNVPADNPKTAASHKKMRDFAKEHQIDFWEGKGVCHQIMMENYVRPGELIFGADSHTCTYGALGAFGTGVGCTDFLYGMVTGTSWVLVPETVKLNLMGKLREDVYPRDLMLHIIGKIGANGVNYQVMEFTGDGVKTLSVNDRMVLCNLAVEAGAKSAIFQADEIALKWLAERGRTPKQIFESDTDAHYFKEYTFNLDEIKPIVAKPDFVDDVIPARDACGIKIDEAFLGSCNNGRIDEMRVAARLLKGRKVADTVRFLIVPASNEVYMQALEEGLIEIFMEAGAMVMNANCSVCWGSCQGVMGANEVLISTGTRNFKGRAGHPTSKVYLGSAATVTASAIKGSIATENQL
ncbi:3-isopropylmalate dehydratase large subunit [Aminipila sp.]|uniref:3-isopropylmalate dehydratase large subunit n=1 Tax=Aminipila sp. TaxID=2060095 RepID=UPI002F3F07B8